MMTAPRFSLTQKQIRDLIAATPQGYVPEITVSFKRDDDKSKADAINPADLIEP